MNVYFHHLTVFFFSFLSGKCMPFTINNFLPMNWLTVLCCTFEIHGDGRLLIFIYDGIAIVTIYCHNIFHLRICLLNWRSDKKKARTNSKLCNSLLSLYLCLFPLSIFSIKNRIKSTCLRFNYFFFQWSHMRAHIFASHSIGCELTSTMDYIFLFLNVELNMHWFYFVTI